MSVQLKYDVDMKTVGKRFRYVRRSKGYTQLKLAEAIGTNSKYLSKIENGKASPSFPFIMRFAEVTGCDLNYLLRGVHIGDETCQEMIQKEPLIYEIYENDMSKERLQLYNELVKAIFGVLVNNKV